MRRIAVVTIATLLVGCGSAPGPDNSVSVPIPVSQIVALTCHLKGGADADIGRRIKTYGRDRDAMEITFTGFDWANHRAQMIGNKGVGAVEARVETGPLIQMVFIERAPIGNTMMTSVFFTPADLKGGAPDRTGTLVKGKQASVVHSRHVLLLTASAEAEAVVSQTTGVCDIKF